MIIIEELDIKHYLIGSEMSSIKLFVMNIYLMTHESFIFSRRHIFSFKRLNYDMIILTWHLFAQWGMQKFDGCFICFRWHWILQPYFYIAQGLLLHIFARRKNLIFLFIYQFNMTVNTPNFKLTHVQSLTPYGKSLSFICLKSNSNNCFICHHKKIIKPTLFTFCPNSSSLMKMYFHRL